MTKMKSHALSTFKYLFLSIVSLISIFPLYWMLVATTNHSVDITRGRLFFGSALIENFRSLLGSDLMFGTAFRNSVIISIVTVILAMLTSSAAGYAFVIYKSRGKDALFKAILLSMMVPFAALMVPLFSLFGRFSNMGPLSFIALNTPMSVVIISIATAFLIFFFRQNAMSFPKELVEAARIDGLGEFPIFIRVFVPTMKSCYAAAIIVTFMASWNAYMWPLITLRTPEQRTLPLVVAALGSSYNPDFGMIMLAVFLTTLPTVILFFVMQKHFVAGMMGSVKG